ncbi:MAG TPA: cytochrome P450 [Gaiella sp.]|uniref:cytochrome P450 n=1 Tax=Gaiella sp. TaxID=2663207 RepID=UPI002D806096|nr:cytochrome P450 [Gaiella sp.]HET9289121.1 cytochrome P450 [Gaiella sp.]
MTEPSWHDLGPADDSPEGVLRRVEVEGRAVCVGRTAGGWVAFDDTCTHEECSLAEGELDGGVVVCPCHGSEFDVRTGDVLTPPALEPLPIYEARQEEGALLVRLAPPPVAEAAAHARDDHVTEAVSRQATVPGPSLEGLVVDDVDLTDLDVWEERVPYDWLALLRREAPLHWQPERDGRGFWALTRYDDVVQVSKDWQTFSSELGGTSLQDLTEEELEARKSMIDTDPPPHTRMRALVNKGFTPRVVNAYEERIRGLARGILTNAFEQAEFDWVESVAAEIPMWVFSEIMGLPVEDRRLIIELGDKILGNTDPEVVGEEYVAERALQDPELRRLPFSSPFSLDLIEYGRALGEKRRSDPRDDITTRLVEAELDGSRLSEQEFGVMFILLTTAGNETTRHTISLGLLDLLEHPDELQRLVGDPSLAGLAADELLRRAHPVHHFRRTATRDVVMHGRRIREGDKVTIWYAAANYDEEKFADPYRLDVGRTPNRHVTFGLGGPHFCLGAHLARLEIKVWLEEMVPYLPRLEPVGDPVRLRSNFFNGIKRMPVRVRG